MKSSLPVNHGLPEELLGDPALVPRTSTGLAGTGISADMSHCVIVCDEIQILGDEQRGRNIEVLLTLLRKTRWGQLIGLSAVIDTRDARDLKDWFGVTLVRLDRREKHLHYECRTPTRVRTFQTDQPEAGVQDRSRAQQEQHEPTALVHQLARDKSALPIVVFCMTRKRVEEAVQGYARSLGVVVSPTQPLLPALNESTAAARNLSSFIPRRFAFHTADLLEEERNLVEDKLKSSQLDVVFATSTLAAGVNFPFKTAVFDSWTRWNARTRNRDPLSASEFHNMAGRVGRMGFRHSHGSVLFTAADTFFETRAWHDTVRNRYLAQQLRRLDEADRPLLQNFYGSREKQFESAFQALLERVGIRYTLFDADLKVGAFDYLLHFDDRPDVIVECKTKQGNNLVDLNAARVVLGSSGQYGHRDTFCVTLCQPGIDPNVPEKLQAVVRLCVVETHDLAEAFTRLMRQSMSMQAFHDWLTQPGQAKAETLVVHTRSTSEPEAPALEAP
jgi:hypothetical protein